MLSGFKDNWDCLLGVIIIEELESSSKKRFHWLTFSTKSIQMCFSWQKDGFASWNNSHFAKTVGSIYRVSLPATPYKSGIAVTFTVP